VLPAAAPELAEFVVAARAALPDSVRLIVTEDARGVPASDGVADSGGTGPEWVDLVRVRGGGLTTLVHQPLRDAVPAGSHARMLSGRPLGRSRLLVLERGLQPAPIGVCGLLAVDGAAAPTRLLLPDAAPPGAGPRHVDVPGCGKAIFLTSRQARLRPDGQIELI
jgi:hypothetical protein